MILNVDACQWLRAMPEGFADLIVTDPPYRTISGGNRESGNQRHGRPSGMLSKNDGRIFKHNDAPVETWMPLLYRALKSPGHCYVMTNLLNLWDFHRVAVECGFKVHNLLIWSKNTCTPNRWYMKDAEYILFLRKGPARSIYTPGAKTILRHDTMRGKTHETQKPVSLMRDLIVASSLPGDVVLDPFMGTGSTGVAALNEGREFIGCEIDAGYYEVAGAWLDSIDT